MKRTSAGGNLRGMKQPRRFARALGHGPKVLLARRAVRALDALTRAHSKTRCKTSRRAWAHVVMITHDVDEAVLLSDAS